MSEDGTQLDSYTAPPEILALAERLGAAGQPFPRRVHFEQHGAMRNLSAAKWMRFTARQWMNPQECEFRWLARTGPLGLLRIEDSLIASAARGRVSLLGLIPLESAQSTPQLIKAQLMRYLAELPWVPDALLHNRDLRYAITGKSQLQVSAQLHGISGAVTILLNGDGLPETVSGLRPRTVDGGTIETPWHASYLDYRHCDGRLVPSSGRVGWTVDGQQHEVWRGEFTHWSARS